MVNKTKASFSSGNIQSLKKLLRLFDVSEGCFSFAAATYQTVEIRDKYIKTLQSEYEFLEVISIHDKDRSILEQVLDCIKDNKTRAIFVTDIESLVVDNDTCLHPVSYTHLTLPTSDLV